MFELSKRSIGKTKIEMDVLGLGCAPLGGNFVDLNYNQAAEIIKFALDSGIRYFDTAPWYGFGRSERVVGDQLRNSQFIISSKVGRILKPGAVDNPSNYGMVDPLPFHPVYDYSYDGIMRSFEDGLQRLGLDQIDILLVHDIGEFQHGEENQRHFKDLSETGYKAMDELRNNDVVKAIGLGVNENKVCLDALEIGNWDVFLLAGRYTLLEQTPLDSLFPKCKNAGTSIICGGPFNSGVLVGREMWNYANAPKDVVNKVKSLKKIAENFNIPLPAAALQFPLFNEIITSVIPGARSKNEFKQILQWFTLKIPIDFWKELRAKELIHHEAPISNN